MIFEDKKTETGEMSDSSWEEEESEEEDDLKVWLTPDEIKVIKSK